MSIIVQIQLFDTINGTLDQKVSDYFKTTEYSIVKETKNETNTAYDVEIFKGKVVKTHITNLAYFDDYRPGIVATAFEDGVVKTASVSVEYSSYHCEKDADEDTVNAYEGHLRYIERKSYVLSKLKTRNEFMEDGHAIGLTYHDMKRLFSALESREYYDEAVKMLKSLKKETLRSKFRKSLATQIFNWLTDPVPQFNKPLSQNQMRFLTPFRKY